jgi:hypothetical protein
MIKIIVTQKQKQFAEDYILSHNISKRGIYDGSLKDKFTGTIGEKVIYDALKLEKNDITNFDNGIDLTLNKLLIDIKTKVRRFKTESWFAWNIPLSQFNNPQYKNNSYLFCSFNDKNDILTIEGWITKEEAIKRCLYLPKGAYRLKSNGQKFPSDKGYPCEVIELVQSALFPLESFEDLIFHSKNYMT